MREEDASINVFLLLNFVLFLIERDMKDSEKFPHPFEKYMYFCNKNLVSLRMQIRRYTLAQFYSNVHNIGASRVIHGGAYSSINHRAAQYRVLTNALAAVPVLCFWLRSIYPNVGNKRIPLSAPRAL